MCAEEHPSVSAQPNPVEDRGPQSTDQGQKPETIPPLGIPAGDSFREVRQMTFPIAQKLRRLAAAVSLLLLAFTLLPTARAQETTGAIQGTITDPTGAVV